MPCKRLLRFLSAVYWTAVKWVINGTGIWSRHDYRCTFRESYRDKIMWSLFFHSRLRLVYRSQIINWPKEYFYFSLTEMSHLMPKLWHKFTKWRRILIIFYILRIKARYSLQITFIIANWNSRNKCVFIQKYFSNSLAAFISELSWRSFY